MNVLIVEDEQASADKLIRYLNELRPEWNVLSATASIKQTLDYLNSNPEPDIIFLDVQLANEESLRIFDQIEVNFYIIFLTNMRWMPSA
jgi:two-component SAPR family response regulator